MMQSLAEFDDDALYLDAMLLVAFIDASSPWHFAARQLFQRVLHPVRPLHLVTATLTIDEVVFVLLQELLARPPYAITRSRGQYLAAHPEVVQTLMSVVDGPLQGLIELVSLEPVLPADVATMRQEMATTGLLPRDALHVAIMRRLGLTALASADSAFARCAGISLFTP